MKYIVDATITITLEQVKVLLDRPVNNEDEFEDAIMQACAGRLVFLDIKGATSGDDGLVSAIECQSIDGWNAE